MRGPNDLIELNGDDLRCDRSTCARRALSSRVLVASNSARVLRRLGIAAPISTGLIVHKQLEGAYQLKGACHVSLRHSFNRRH
jgi:hypothetical protein